MTAFFRWTEVDGNGRGSARRDASGLLIFRLLAVMCAALVLQACTESRELADISGMGKDSEFEGIRVPDRAELVTSRPGYRDFDVIATSGQELSDFLAVTLPEGRDYRDWTFCRMDSRRDGGRIVEEKRVYVRGGQFYLEVEWGQFRLSDVPFLTLRSGTGARDCR